MQKLRAAVIGVGHLGAFHADKYHAHPEVDLTAVVDVDKERAGQIAEKLGAQAYTDYREILDKVDMVSIVTPTQQHAEVTSDCLAAGVHVLLEKPMTQTLDEAQSLIDLAQKNKVVLQVGHLERFNPAVQALQGQLGQTRFIECHRLAPYNPRGTDVDVVLDLMIHDIDIILSMIPSPLNNIQAVGIPVLTDEVDIANARLEFANGCVVNATASRVSDKRMRKFRIFEANAYFSLDLGDHKLSVYRKQEDQDPDASVPGIDVNEQTFEKSDALMEEVRAFVHAIKNNVPPVVSGDDGKRALEVALKVKQAIAP